MQSVYIFFSVLLFLYWQVSGNVEKAREVLAEAVEHVPLSKPLLEVLFLSLPDMLVHEHTLHLLKCHIYLFYTLCIIFFSFV